MEIWSGTFIPDPRSRFFSIQDTVHGPKKPQISNTLRLKTFCRLSNASANRIFVTNVSDALTNRILPVVFQAYYKSTPPKESIEKMSSFTRYVSKKFFFSCVVGCWSAFIWYIRIQQLDKKCGPQFRGSKMPNSLKICSFLTILKCNKEGANLNCGI